MPCKEGGEGGREGGEKEREAKKKKGKCREKAAWCRSGSALQSTHLIVSVHLTTLKRLYSSVVINRCEMSVTKKKKKSIQRTKSYEALYEVTETGWSNVFFLFRFFF